MQVQVSNHLKLLWAKAMVVSVEEKAYEICQVWSTKVSVERTNGRIENFSGKFGVRLVFSSREENGVELE